MKKYCHDYTKPKMAEKLLSEASEYMSNKEYDKALNKIVEARQFLQEYLVADNMVENENVENGWIKANDVRNELEVFKECMAGIIDAAFDVPFKPEEED